MVLEVSKIALCVTGFWPLRGIPPDDEGPEIFTANSHQLLVQGCSRGCVIFPVLVCHAQVGRYVSGGQKKTLRSTGADMTIGSQASITKVVRAEWAVLEIRASATRHFTVNNWGEISRRETSEVNGGRNTTVNVTWSWFWCLWACWPFCGHSLFLA